jgi:hypothetical protein
MECSRRVYFSEALIVFTSNLGIYRSEPDGSRVANVSSDDAFPDVQAKVRSEIERYFKTVLNRPEILNRIGDNIVVFDFIRPDSNVLVSAISFALAGVLLFVAMPDRHGVSPRFLRFEAAPILYPPVILVFLAMGAANLISAFAG